MYVQFYWTSPQERQVRIYHAVAQLLRCLDVPDPTLAIALHDLARRLEAIECETGPEPSAGEEEARAGE